LGGLTNSVKTHGGTTNHEGIAAINKCPVSSFVGLIDLPLIPASD
jgi:hypothetical protein